VEGNATSVLHEREVGGPSPRHCSIQTRPHQTSYNIRWSISGSTTRNEICSKIKIATQLTLVGLGGAAVQIFDKWFEASLAWSPSWGRRFGVVQEATKFTVSENPSYRSAPDTSTHSTWACKPGMLPCSYYVMSYHSFPSLIWRAEPQRGQVARVELALSLPLGKTREAKAARYIFMATKLGPSLFNFSTLRAL
jgi:hypothetical protein